MSSIISLLKTKYFFFPDFKYCTSIQSCNILINVKAGWFGSCLKNLFSNNFLKNFFYINKKNNSGRKKGFAVSHCCAVCISTICFHDCTWIRVMQIALHNVHHKQTAQQHLILKRSLGYGLSLSVKSGRSSSFQYIFEGFNFPF